MSDPEVSYYLKANEMATSDDPENAALGRLTKDMGMILPTWTENELLRGTPVEVVFNAAVRSHAATLASIVLALTAPGEENPALAHTLKCLIILFDSYMEKTTKQEKEEVK